MVLHTPASFLLVGVEGRGEETRSQITNMYVVCSLSMLNPLKTCYVYNGSIDASVTKCISKLLNYILYFI